MLNEDSWLRVAGSFGSLIVVSDGVGSCEHARHGSKAVCKAVHNAVIDWDRSGEILLEDLISRIEPIWKNLITPFTPEECQATCLFALARANGDLIVCGLGDGMALVKWPKQKTEWVLGLREDGFSNQTIAIGGFSDNTKWKKYVAQNVTEAVVVLASDGISDDIIPENIDDFVKWIIEEFGGLSPFPRWCLLRDELLSWPTPNHLDDKTLALLWINKNEVFHGLLSE